MLERQFLILPYIFWLAIAVYELWDSLIARFYFNVVELVKIENCKSSYNHWEQLADKIELLFDSSNMQLEDQVLCCLGYFFPTAKRGNKGHGLLYPWNKRIARRTSAPTMIKLRTSTDVDWRSWNVQRNWMTSESSSILNLWQWSPGKRLIAER